MPRETFSAVSIDTSGLERTMKDLRRDQVPYAMKEAINYLQKDTIRVERFEMQIAFDRPTPFILRGLRGAKWATKKDPTAAIWFVDVYGKKPGQTMIEDILRPQISGGDRNIKSTEKRLRMIGVIEQDEWLIGVKTAQNVYGNISGPKHQQMLSYFRAYWEAGFTANRVFGESASKRGNRFFVQKVGNGRGIFQVTGRRGKPKLIWYLGKKPIYRPRFHFFDVAEDHAKKWSPYFARKAMDKALATARPI